MKRLILAGSMVGLAVACGRPPHAPAEHSKVAVVEFSVAPNVKIERFGGNPASLGMPVAEVIAGKIRDDNALDAQAIPQTAAPEGDLIVRGEITHVDGGNTAARWSVLVCWFCGWWTGYAVVGAQGEVVRRDGTLVGVFSEEKVGSAWGEASSVVAAAQRAAEGIGEMVIKGEYRGGHPGSDGYLAPVSIAQPAPQRPNTGAFEATEPLSVGAPAKAPAERMPIERPAVDHSAADRLRALDDLRAQGLISDAEYAEKRKQILQEF